MFMHDEVVIGDELELRGPIGGWFVWHADRPVLLIGGGSGVVPVMSMLRFARKKGSNDLVRLVVSVRRIEDLYYSDELPGPETMVIYTRIAPPGTKRLPGRISDLDLRPLLIDDATVYISGSSPFADAATDAVMRLGVSAEHIRVERFGPSG